MEPPFSYFGGKRKVAKDVLKRFGKFSNYIEPFAGSLAVLLANENIPKIETVNDIDCYLSNFWRAVLNDPDTVAKFADYPVNEADLHARHNWLVSSVNDEFRNKMHSDPDYYDCKIAGYWVWGISCSIGNNWLNTKGLKSTPLLSSAGGGINGLKYNIQEDFEKLQSRLRNVRVACGDWKRVVSPSITYKNKSISKKDITAIFLDPPYDFKNRDKVYLNENNIFNDVLQWALDNGNNDKLRIALCGYYDEKHNIPNDWEIYSWQANGGMANLGNDRGKLNAKKEVIYFSPYCIRNINDISRSKNKII